MISSEHPALKNKSAGILFPLSSMRRKNGWGIGDFSALAQWSKWAGDNGIKIIQLLPLNHIFENETCPYSSMSAFAIDPIYITVDDFAEYSPQAEKLNAPDKVDYKSVRALKMSVLKTAFEKFFREHWVKNTVSSAKFREFIKENSYWLNDYAVFSAAKTEYKNTSWQYWENLRAHKPHEVGDFCLQRAPEVLFFEYLQWIAQTQFDEAKEIARRNNVLFFGDIPFTINSESADVWANQEIFDLRLEVGAPPDQFSATGQSWGLPSYNWWNLEASGFNWWRKRMRRARNLYDIIRLDHIVGFFRTWEIPLNAKERAGFDIKDEHQQNQRGIRFLSMICQERGAGLPSAEDLGVVPDFVRKTLADFNIPGYKVLRWEKDGEIFRDPKNYGKISVAVSSTHDTTPLKLWWREMPRQEKDNLWKVLVNDGGVSSDLYDDKVHETLLRGILNSSSAIAIFSMQDILGTEDRINTPGTVNGGNWTYRCPLTPDNIKESADASGRINLFRNLILQSGRTG